MKQKAIRGVFFATLILTVLSLMFFVGLMLYNIRRVILIQDSSVLAVIISVLFILISIVLVIAVAVSSFVPFFKEDEFDHKQYINILYLLIVFRLILYVFFSLVDYRLSDQVTGHLGGIHYLTYVFVYRTDLLPVTVFSNASVQFIHSLMGTDVLSIGAVILGFSIYDKYRVAPFIGAVFGIIINLVFITIINISVVNEHGAEFLYYKVDAVFATLLVEFAMLGYVMYRLLEKKEIEEKISE